MPPSEWDSVGMRLDVEGPFIHFRLHHSMPRTHLGPQFFHVLFCAALSPGRALWESGKAWLLERHSQEPTLKALAFDLGSRISTGGLGVRQEGRFPPPECWLGERTLTGPTSRLGDSGNSYLPIQRTEPRWRPSGLCCYSDSFLMPL